MSLKPWREIARPHKDVLEGTFKQSEFAADITQVATGIAQPEYQDAQMFFSRTFITEGMRLLLSSVAQRLSGLGGDPVIQLQTAFGGGKTHTMLAVLHLASRKVSTSELEGIPPILDAAGITELPKARVAVIDGIALAPSQELLKKDGQKVTTLWGELAWQLLGEEGFAMLRESDEKGTSPGKSLLVELLSKAAPCVVLIDELVAFLRQFEPGKTYRAGTFDSNLSFIQALTEAMKAVPNAILLASLPESELEVGGTQGLRALNSLEKYFGRVESVWKPVASEESFEIVRRRLFESAGEKAEVEEVCRRFADFYKDNAGKFPLETQGSGYYDRLCSSYPIHPEIFDRLYQDWSTLDKFQRTRGVLQYMAIVIHRLWNSDNRDTLIMPGSIDLADGNVRNKSIHYLPQGWEPVIEREVDGPKSESYEIDSRDTRFGSVQAARRSMRTIFLGSAPSGTGQVVKGIQVERILLGAVQPAQTIGVFEDVLKRLRDRLHYLYSEQDRFWLDTKPNLRREMESRTQSVTREELDDLLKSKVRSVFASNHSFSGIHVFVSSGDVPDEYAAGPRLVVLPPKAGYSKADGKAAFSLASEILTRRGDQPRQKRNRLIFFAPDHDVVSRLKEAGRVLIAWQSIVADIEDEKLNLDNFQTKQARKNKDGAEQALKQVVRDCYKWLLCPSEDFVSGKPELRWEAVSVSSAATNLIVEIENRLKEEEWLVTEWSPVHLKHLLEKWYFKDGSVDVSALKVYQDCCHYLYMPRLLNDTVFKVTLSAGVASADFFGMASGKDGDQYLGFTFDRNTMVGLDTETLIIQRDAALAYREASKPPATTEFPAGSAEGSGHTVTPQPVTSGAVMGSPAVGNAQQPAAKTHFYGTVNIDPVKAKMDFAQIFDEVIEQFTSKVGVNVRISVEIQADSGNGFDESAQRTINENCNVLKFSSAEFEEG